MRQRDWCGEDGIEYRHLGRQVQAVHAGATAVQVYGSGLDHQPCLPEVTPGEPAHDRLSTGRRKHRQFCADGTCAVTIMTCYVS